MTHRDLLRASVILGVAFLSGGMAQQPPAAPEEVHVSSRPYAPFQLRTESTVVQVAVVVRDRNGRAVSGLQKDDFHLTDQGKDRGVTDFAVDVRDVPGGTGSVAGKGREASTSTAPDAPHPPRFIDMFFDDIGTAAPDVSRMKRDATRFVEDGMSPGDRMAIVATSTGRMTDFLGDKKQIADAIGRIQAHPRFSPNGDSGCPRMTPYESYVLVQQSSEQTMQMKIAELQACSGSTPSGGAPARGPVTPRPRQLDPTRNLILQQAEMQWNQVKTASQATMDVLSAALTDLSAQKGSRMLLLVSSGFLTGGLEGAEDALANKALAAGIVINAMDARGLYVEAAARPFGDAAPPPNLPTQVTAWESIMQNISAEAPIAVLADLTETTGGLFFHHNNDFSFGFRELGSIPEVTYLLGFRPDDAALDGKFHKLKVRLASSNAYTIEARPGYFATPRTPPAPDSSRAELDRQVMKPDIIQSFPTVVQMQYGPKNASGSTPVHIQMHVDIQKLVFGQQNGRHTQRLTFVFALLDQNDAIVSAREGAMEFALTDERYRSLQESGVNAALTLEAPAGKYRLRAVAMEGARGQIAAQAYIVQVP